MDNLWISAFSFLNFLCFGISLINTAEWVTTIWYSDADAFTILCSNSSQIQIHTIDVHEKETPCSSKPCVLNSQDTKAIKDNCNGRNSCLVYYNFTTICLRKFRYINMSYACKHENKNSVNTFEDNAGDWMNASFTSVPWQRQNLIPDHTNGTSNPNGYSMAAVSYPHTAGAARIETERTFVKPVCLSLWYRFYNAYDCSFIVYKTFNGTQISLFTANCTTLLQWIKISVDVYEESPYKVALEAVFQNHSLRKNRAILIDDTLIAYRPCQGQLVNITCQDISLPITIECNTRFLNGDFKLSLQHGNLISHQTNCEAKSIESRINTFCRTFNKSDQCEFRVLDFINGYEECTGRNTNVSVTYQCIDSSQTTINMKISTGTIVQSGDIPEGPLKSPEQYDMIGIAAGVSGGVIFTIIAVVIIYRINRSKPCKQEASSNNGNKAFDELQYDDKCQQKPTLSQFSSQNIITPTNSNLNIPEQLDQDGQESADLYNMSNEDGTYDVSSNDRQKGNSNDNNIYSHTTDNIYDSGSHHKVQDRNEETYDHFFGQQTEDEYDTTTRT